MSWDEGVRRSGRHLPVVRALVGGGAAAVLAATGVVEVAEGGVIAVAAAVVALSAGIGSELRATREEGRKERESEAAGARASQQSHLDLRETRYNRLKALTELGTTGHAVWRDRLTKYTDDDIDWLDLRIAQQTLMEEGSIGQIDPQAIERVTAPRDLADTLQMTSNFTGRLDAEGWLRRGNAYLQVKEWTRAIDAFDHVLALRPDDLAATFNRGYALGDLERHTEALAAYDRCLELRPDNPSALNNRGSALARLGRNAEALEAFECSLEFRPDDPNALTNRGNALSALGRHDEALAALDRSLRLRPDDPDALNNRGVALSALGRHAEALAVYDRSLELRPDDPSTHYNRGCMLARLERRDEAFAAVGRAVELGWSDVELACRDADLESLRGDARFTALFDCDAVGS